MKRLIYFFVLLFAFTCCNNKFQKVTEQKDKDYSYINCHLQCNELDSLLPQIAIFDKNPVSLFKSKYSDISKMKPDSIAQKWNDFVKANNTFIYHMYPKGALLCEKDNNKKIWVATTAIIKDQTLLMWTKKATFKIGYKYNITFDCKNIIKF